jgi:peptide deformylase
MMSFMLLKIVQAGDPVLRQVGRTLTAEEILDPATQQLIALMRDTMRDAPGVGLAAPQVGESIQLAVIEDPAPLADAQREERRRVAVPLHVLVNPVLTIVDPTPVEFHEGCLSVAGFLALVPRAARVRVEALNERAEAVSIEASGWYARILQHEIDHLNGRLYVDRMRPESFTTNANLARR